MRNLSKFAALLQTPEPISAISGPKLIILWGHVEEVLLFNKFFFPIVNTCLSCEDIALQSCAMVHRWRILGDFLHSVFQQDTCSTFQTCILNSQSGHIMRGSIADIRFAMAENRWEKKQKPQGLKRMSASATQGGHNKLNPLFSWLSYIHRTFHGHINGKILREKSEKDRKTSSRLHENTPKDEQQAVKQAHKTCELWCKIKWHVFHGSQRSSKH